MTDMSDDEASEAARLRREIAEKRAHLATDLQVLRENVHEQLSVQGQVERHPRIALGVLAALGAFGALIGVLALQLFRTRER